MRDFLKHSSLVFGGTLATNVIFYVAYALVQRALGVKDAGLFMALLATTQLLAVPGTVLATVIAKMSADAAAEGRYAVLRSLSRQTTLLFLPLLLFAVFAALVCSNWLGDYFHTADNLTLLFAAVAFALFFPLGPQRAVFQGGARFTAYVLSGAIEATLKAFTGVTLFLLGGSVRLAFAGFALATAVSYGYNAVAGRGASEKRESVKVPAATIRKHLIGVVLPISGLTAVTFADVILVRHYLPAYASGLYAIIALVGRAIVTITQFVPTVLMPKATDAVANGRSPVTLLGAAAGATLLVVIPVLLLVGIFPGAIAGALAGGAFRPAAPLMLPYATAMAGLAVATVLASYLIGINRRGFAIPLTAVCVGEVVAIVLIHPDVISVVRIVLTGHLCACATVLIATLLSLRQIPKIDEEAIIAAEFTAAQLSE